MEEPLTHYLISILIIITITFLLGIVIFMVIDTNRIVEGFEQRTILIKECQIQVKSDAWINYIGDKINCCYNKPILINNVWQDNITCESKWRG